MTELPHALAPEGVLEVLVQTAEDFGAQSDKSAAEVEARRQQVHRFALRSPRAVTVTADAIGVQMGVALRFMDRLVALSPGQVAIIRPSGDLDGYAEAIQTVQAHIDAAPERERGAPPHPTGGLRACAWRADRHLDTLNITGELWDLARVALRGILVARRLGARLPARVLYRPFEGVIPYASISEE